MTALALRSSHWNCLIFPVRTLVAEMNTTAAGGLETWGEFRARIVLPPGEVSLFVGDENAEDGGLEGVTISLTVR